MRSFPLFETGSLSNLLLFIALLHIDRIELCRTNGNATYNDIEIRTYTRTGVAGGEAARRRKRREGFVGGVAGHTQTHARTHTEKGNTEHVKHACDTEEEAKRETSTSRKRFVANPFPNLLHGEIFHIA